MKYLSDLYSKAILGIIIFGGAFLIIALFSFKRDEGGLLALLKGQFGPAVVEEVEQNPFTAKKESGLTAEDVPELSRLDQEVSKINALVSPSIVSINTGNRSRMGRSEEGQGSGVIVSEEGHVMTNYHVIASKKNIFIELEDGDIRSASVVGFDPSLDLAMLKIKGEGTFQPLAFGNSDDVKIGHKVFAFGNPFRLGVSFSEGSVSATNRSISDVQNDLFQLTAFLNPGQSGGALVNIRGELVGINSAIYSTDKQSPRFQGIGFAIPSNNVKESMDIIFKRKKPVSGYLGISLGRLTESQKVRLGYKRNTGALISNVVPMSPAEKGGIKPKDIVSHFNDKLISHNRHLIALVKKHALKTVSLTLWRSGKEMVIEVKLDDIANPKQGAADSPEALALVNISQKVGIIAEDLTKEEKGRKISGVRVVSVIKGSYMENKVLPGEYIFKVNRRRFSSEKEFNNLLRNFVYSGETDLTVLNIRTRRIRTVRLPQMSLEK